MGRKRERLEFIEDKKRRKCCYGTRKSILKKKAYELATLCDIQVLAICLGGPDQRLDVWPEDGYLIKHLIARYLGCHQEVIAEENRSKLAELIDDLYDASQLEDMSAVSLRELLVFLDSKLLQIKDMIQKYYDEAEQSLVHCSAENECQQIVPYVDDPLMQIDPNHAEDIATFEDPMQFAMNPKAYQMISNPVLSSSAAADAPPDHLLNSSTGLPGNRSLVPYGANENLCLAIGFLHNGLFYPLPPEYQMGINAMPQYTAWSAGEHVFFLPPCRISSFIGEFPTSLTVEVDH